MKQVPTMYEVEAVDLVLDGSDRKEIKAEFLTSHSSSASSISKLRFGGTLYKSALARSLIVDLILAQERFLS